MISYIATYIVSYFVIGNATHAQASRSAPFGHFRIGSSRSGWDAARRSNLRERQVSGSGLAVG